MLFCEVGYRGIMACEAAVDDDCLPGDVAGFVRGQECDGGGNIFRRAEIWQCVMP